MIILQAIPALAIVVAAYNAVFVFGSRALGDVIAEVTLPSGDIWPITAGDVLILAALALLLLELVSVGARRISLVNHALSALVLFISIAELLLVRGCGTPEFAVITLILAVDVLAGYSIT